MRSKTVLETPSNSTQILEANIIRLSYAGPAFSSLDQVTRWITNVKGTIADTFNVFIVPLSNILNEASYSGSTCVVDFQTIGGSLNQGLMHNFKLGMSLCQSMGTNMGLTHIWDSQRASQIMPDIPLQRSPNYLFEFFSGADGARNCNRMKDCARYNGNQPTYNGPIVTSGPPASWMCSGSPCNDCDNSSILFEMGCNIMDYATDPNIVMFTASQCSAMRTCLLSNANGVSLRVGDNGTLTVASPNDQWTNVPPNPPKNSKSFWSKNPLYFIIAFSVLAAILIFVFAYWMHLRRRHARKQN